MQTPWNSRSPMSCPHASVGFNLRTKHKAKRKPEENLKWGRTEMSKEFHPVLHTCPSCSHKVSLNSQYFPLQKSEESQKFISFHSAPTWVREVSYCWVGRRTFLISDNRCKTSLCTWKLRYIKLDMVLK